MAIEVVMPQMGESVAEGTVVRWIKKVGDHVERDEPLLEISTDKVDAEIPSPTAGVIAEIRAMEGETVLVGSVVAVIGQPEESNASAPVAARTAAPPQPAQASEVTAALAEEKATDALPRAIEETRRRSTSLARRIAREHHVDLSQLTGTGVSRRITKRDVLERIGQTGDRSPETLGRAASAIPTAAASSPAGTAGAAGTVKMSAMRKKIAEHMVLSRRTSAHVHSVFEVDFSGITRIRAAKKGEYEQAGAKLTYLSFVVKAVVDALRQTPAINASIDGDNVVYHRDVNVGIAVALDSGLIVPVIKHADELSLRGLSRAVADLANRARTKQLKPDEVVGGTFTVTSPGGYGALLATPIINQPQVAILGVGAIEKRPVVVDDAIAIRSMGYLSLGYDHRLVDGAVADEFMSRIKRKLESWSSAIDD